MQNPNPHSASNISAGSVTWSKTREVFSTFGFLNGILYGLDQWLYTRAGGRRLVHYRLMAQRVPEAGANAELPDDFEVRVAAPGDPILAAFPIEDEILSYRFDQGATCLIVLRRDTVLGCFWLTLGPYLEDEVRCRFVPEPSAQAAWDFDVYIPPEHRLGRAFLRLWQAAFARLRAEGRSWSMSRISVFNTRSLTSHRALGAVPVGRALFIKGKRWQLLLATRAPFVHFSGRPDRVPTIRVRAPDTPD